MNDNPLVTFALVAYNQEQFIEEAVRSALGQDYSPLDIVISDDCSSDSTFEKIKEIVDKYNGPHEVRLSRNNENMGIGNHVNKIMDLARGELVVMAAGDDISRNDRTSLLVKEWQQRENVYGVGSYCTIIDDNGEKIEYDYKWNHKKTSLKLEFNIESVINKNEFSILGATAAWDKRLWSVYGPFGDHLINEDGVLSLRACMIGRIVVINDSLVDRRIHDNNAWIGKNKNMENIYDKINMNRLSMMKQCVRDVKYHYEQIDKNDRISLIWNIYDSKLRKYQARSEWWSIGYLKRFFMFKVAGYSLRRDWSMIVPKYINNWINRIHNDEMYVVND